MRRFWERRSLSRIIGRLLEKRDDPARRLTAPVPSGDGSARGEPPIFVIGCFRSGTSILRRVFDSHSRIACPPESKFVLAATQLLRDRKALEGLDSMGFGRAEVASALGAFIDGFFGGYAAARGKMRWADKTPDYVDCLAELWEVFGPDGRFVLIIRHGLDVAYSLSDPHRHYPAIASHIERAGGNVPVAAGVYWAEQTEKIEAFRQEHPEASFQLRYEELTSRPEAVLRSMFEFVGEPWEPEVLQYNRFPHDVGLEDPDVKRRSRIVANSGKYRAWPVELQKAVREACRSTLVRLGYE